MQNNYKVNENKFEVKDNIIEIIVQNKKGKEFTAIINKDDFDRVKAQGIWFAEWSKDLNAYTVQNINSSIKNKKGKPVKQSLQGFILGVNAKAPIRHIDGDYLNNTKENLEIVDRHVKNTFEINDDIAYIILNDKYGREEARAIISKEDLEILINDEYNWAIYRNEVVANTENGRIYLDEFLLDPSESEIVHHINLNPLDNRRENLEIHLIEA